MECSIRKLFNLRSIKVRVLYWFAVCALPFVLSAAGRACDCADPALCPGHETKNWTNPGALAPTQQKWINAFGCSTQIYCSLGCKFLLAALVKYFPYMVVTSSWNKCLRSIQIYFIQFKLHDIYYKIFFMRQKMTINASRMCSKTMFEKTFSLRGPTSFPGPRFELGTSGLANLNKK